MKLISQKVKVKNRIFLPAGANRRNGGMHNRNLFSGVDT